MGSEKPLNLWLRPRLSKSKPIDNEYVEGFEATAQVTLHFDCEGDAVKFAISILQGWTKNDHEIHVLADVDLHNLQDLVGTMEEDLPKLEESESDECSATVTRNIPLVHGCLKERGHDPPHECEDETKINADGETMARFTWTDNQDGK